MSGIVESMFHLRATWRSPLTPRGELSPTPVRPLSAKDPCRRQQRNHTLPRLARRPRNCVERFAKQTARAISRVLLQKVPSIGSYASSIPAIVLVGFASSVVLAGAAFAQQTQGPSTVQSPQPLSADSLAAKSRQLPEYTASGELKLPKDWREWIFIGDPFTPNALNGGKANFPEFHNVYIEPGSFDIYRKTGVFPEGTIFFKELQLTLGPAENPDGSQSEPSGRGYFPGKFNGADVTVKDSKRFADTDGWGYFNFHHYEPKALTAAAQPKSNCAFCHIASAKRDEVWTQFYAILDEVPLPQGGKKP